MDTIEPQSINYASYNPRTMTEFDAKNLGTSMTKWGDISGITSNRRTNNYVTGHQRMKTLDNKFQNRVKIYIEHRNDQPDEYGTVAIGYVGVEGTNLRFAYRQVDWNETVEKIVNVAANRIEADWNREMLAELNQDLAQADNGKDLLELTGQSDDELERLNKEFGPDETEQPQTKEDNNSLTFALTRQQREVVEEAIKNIAATHDMSEMPNSSINGNALFFMAQAHLDQVHQAAGDAPAA
jgi:hypothetical protein